VRDARPWTYAAVFGSLWGAAEVSLGALMSATRVPLSGLLMASIGVVCLLTARRLQPAIGSSLVMGVVVAFVKVFSLGGFIVGPVVGILSEALLVELAMTLTASRGPGAVLGGALALASPPAWLLASAALLTGPAATTALERALTVAARALGWRGAVTGPIAAAAIVCSALLGAAVGAAAWVLAGRVARRVGSAA
jgi:hypothetical protein